MGLATEIAFLSSPSHPDVSLFPASEFVLLTVMVATNFMSSMLHLTLSPGLSDESDLELSSGSSNFINAECHCG